MVVELSAMDYQATIEKIAGLGLTSGMIYDAILAAAAQKAGVERLLTFNLKHFVRVWPEGSQTIMAP